LRHLAENDARRIHLPTSSPTPSSSTPSSLTPSSPTLPAHLPYKFIYPQLSWILIHIFNLGWKTSFVRIHTLTLIIYKITSSPTLLWYANSVRTFQPKTGDVLRRFIVFDNHFKFDYVSMFRMHNALVKLLDSIWKMRIKLTKPKFLESRKA